MRFLFFLGFSFFFSWGSLFSWSWGFSYNSEGIFWLWLVSWGWVWGVYWGGVVVNWGWVVDSWFVVNWGGFVVYWGWLVSWSWGWFVSWFWGWFVCWGWVWGLLVWGWFVFWVGSFSFVFDISDITVWASRVGDDLDTAIGKVYTVFSLGVVVVSVFVVGENSSGISVTDSVLEVVYWSSNWFMVWSWSWGMVWSWGSWSSDSASSQS